MVAPRSFPNATVPGVAVAPKFTVSMCAPSTVPPIAIFWSVELVSVVSPARTTSASKVCPPVVAIVPLRLACGAVTLSAFKPENDEFTATVAPASIVSEC